MRRVPVLALAFLLAAGAGGCGANLPSAAPPREIPAQLLEGMYIVALDWPDTMYAGRGATATVRLLLADGTPYEADEYAFFSPDVQVAGLSPTGTPASKHVLGFAPGRVSIVVDAYISPRPHCGCYRYHARLRRDVVVLPAGAVS